MERQTGSHEETQPDPTEEWTDPGTETGLEEPMWQLGLGASGGGGVPSYPERPDEADCIHYLRTGYCGYGPRCRFNHPPDRRSVIGVARAGAVEYPERAGQPVCQYYMRTGTCKFGTSCKFHHPKQGAGSAAVALNYLGYPLRLGEKECSYYLKTGQCKFGASCKFHHPQSASIQVPTPAPPPQVAPAPAPVVAPTVYPPVQSPTVHSSQQYGLVVTRPPLYPSYVQSPYGPMLFSPGMVPYPGWNTYQATVSPVASPSTQPSTGSSSLYGAAQFSSMSAVPGPYQVSLSSVGASSSNQKEKSFPERPGQPDCQYYIKTGDCKFGSSCKYHHPPDLFARETNVVLSPVGLPLRQGAAPCAYYAQHGVCKFGRACKFDHRMGALSYSPSASSLADMPVAPYPVGLSAATLAPSSSSSDLRPELISGSSSISTRVTSSVSTSSVSVGSILSKGESVPQKSSQSSSLGTDSSRSTEERSSS